MAPVRPPGPSLALLPWTATVSSPRIQSGGTAGGCHCSFQEGGHPSDLITGHTRGTRDSWCLPFKALSPKAKVASTWLGPRSLVPVLPCTAFGNLANLKNQASATSTRQTTKMRPVRTTESRPAMIRDAAMTHVCITTRMTLECILLREKRTQKTTFYVISFKSRVPNRQTCGDRKRTDCQRVQGFFWG